MVSRPPASAHCSVKMNAFRAATRLAPRAAARATGSFQQQTASSELGRVDQRRYGGETAHNMHRRSAIQSLVFVTGLYAHYQRIVVVGWFCGWERGREEMGRCSIAWGVIVEAVMWRCVTMWSR